MRCAKQLPAFHQTSRDFSVFYILHVIYSPEVSEGDDPITDAAWVIFQDRLPATPVEHEVVQRFRATLGEDVRQSDIVTFIGVVSDPMMLQVLKAWDRTAIDGPTGLFNLGTP